MTPEQLNGRSNEEWYEESRDMDHDQIEAIASADHEYRLRLAELRSKVEHGFNLLASEAREVFEHYGEPIEELRKRCAECHGDPVSFKPLDGMQWKISCPRCKGSGYEVAK